MMASRAQRVADGRVAGFLYARAVQKFANGIYSSTPRWAALLLPRQFTCTPKPEACSCSVCRSRGISVKVGSAEAFVQRFAASLSKRSSDGIGAPVIGGELVLDQKLTSVGTKKGVISWTPFLGIKKPLTAVRLFHSKSNCGHTQRQSQTDVLRTVEADFVECVLLAPRQVVDGRKFVLIDVREQAELQALGSIPTAINIPLGELETVWNLDPEAFQKRFRRPKPAKDDVLILFCQKGRRSAEGCALLQGKFGLHCLNYEGSFSDWSRRNPPHVGGRKEDSSCTDD